MSGSIYRPTYSIWVGSLPSQADEDDFYDAFSHFGSVRHVNIIKKTIYLKGKPKTVSQGYGFVQFGSHASAIKALNSSVYIKINGRRHYLDTDWADHQTFECFVHPTFY